MLAIVIFGTMVLVSKPLFVTFAMLAIAGPWILDRMRMRGLVTATPDAIYATVKSTPASRRLQWVCFFASVIGIAGMISVTVVPFVV